MPKVECYMCDRPAVGREHVPPACLFPESKDLSPGVELRRDLITVPACGMHNLRKSKDDEYLMMILPTHFRSNEVARLQVRTKVKRAMRKKPNLKRHAYGRQMPALFNGRPTGIVFFDSGRLSRLSEWIVRGLYFHHKDCRKLEGAVFVFPLFGDSLDHSAQRQLNKFRKDISMFFHECDRFGANPEVFFYQIQESANESYMRLTFYGGVEILAAWGNSVTLG